MADTAEGAERELKAEVVAGAEKAFRRALGNVEAVAKSICPVGHYKRKRGFAGRAGGALQQSLHTEYTGVSGGNFTGRAFSNLPYARRQHDEAFHHPGKYSGAEGPRYRAAFFDRGAEIIFGSGRDPAGDPGGMLAQNPPPANFQELLDDLKS